MSQPAIRMYQNLRTRYLREIAELERMLASAKEALHEGSIPSDSITHDPGYAQVATKLTITHVETTVIWALLTEKPGALG